jgi:L-asparaginase
MQSIASITVVLGTGGTIAGTAASAGDHIGYTAAQLGAAQLVAAIPALAGLPIEVEQIAQIDSKDMGFAVWRALADSVHRQLARPEVGGVVITHGTDTLEETAYFLQRVLAPAKPVVLVARGVVAVLAGTVHSALDVRKVHTYRLDAFDSGDAGALGHIEQGRLRQHREWPGGDEGIGLARLPGDAAKWPWVEIITSHAQPRAATVDTLRAAGVHGIVVAGTGNGSLHHVLEATLLEAQAAGVAVLRSTRCMNGRVIDADGAAPALPSAGALTPVQARIELMLQLLARRVA